MPEPAHDSQLIANNSGPTLAPDAPQETIVVVNSITQRPIKPLWVVAVTMSPTIASIQ